MPKQTIHVNVRGIVQGVGFRFTTQMLANKYGITGWVANRPDGSVEFEATANKDDLDAFCRALRQSRVGSGIDQWNETKTQHTQAAIHGFHIRG
jgi:acylphosphatase